jgi:hypothetical protein
MRRDFQRNLELDWAFKDEGSIQKQNRNTDGTKGDHFQSDGKRKLEGGVLELRAFLTAAWQSAWKDWIEEVWRSRRSSLRKGALPNWESLEAWFIKYLNSKMDAGKRWWSEFGQLIGLLKHVHGSADLHNLKTRIKKIIFMITIRRMTKIKTMIGTWMAQRSRLVFLSC